LTRTATTAWPAVTRMLLRSDGSTTLLLEALLDTELSLRVCRQEVVTARDIPAAISRLLKVSPPEQVLVRRSALQTASWQVSRNLVVARRRDDALGGVFTSQHVPIGRGLIAHGLSRSRRPVRTGVGRWRPDGPPCAAKAYLVLDDDQPLAYIEERFNPALVPVPGVDATTLDGYDDVIANGVYECPSKS